MSSCVSETGIVRVKHALIHVSSLGNLGEEEPKCNHDEYSSPNRLGDVVPHFVIESVNLL